MPFVDAWDKPELLAGSDLKAAKNKPTEDDEPLTATDMA